MTERVPPQPPGGGALGRHRTLQAAWREHLGWPEGPPTNKAAQQRYDTVPFCLAKQNGEGVTAKGLGVNLMSDAAITYAKERVVALEAVNGLAEDDRLWHNMLSSQPLAFSIVGELRAFPAAAATVFSELTGREVVALEPFSDPEFPGHTLDGIEAEWFPPRHVHTRDRSAFDIAAMLRLEDGSTLLVTIEVKYTDTFGSTKLDPALIPYPEHLAALGLDETQTRDLIAGGGSQFLRSVMLTDSVRRNGIAGEANEGLGSHGALAAVLARADDRSAERVTDKFAALSLPIDTCLWSHGDFFAAAGRQADLADWARRMQARYLGTDLNSGAGSGFAS